MGEFVARYSGRCGICDGSLRPGDSAVYVDDEVCHAVCPEAVPVAAPCDQCWTIPAANGSCGCDA